MDDLILRTAIWQDEHWLNRSAMLKDDGIARDTTGAVELLLSLDRRLRLKARSGDSFLRQVRKTWRPSLTTGT